MSNLDTTMDEAVAAAIAASTVSGLFTTVVLHKDAGLIAKAAYDNTLAETRNALFVAFPPLYLTEQW